MQPVLSDVDWEVKSAEHWVIRGENGAGKSTLLAAIVGKALVTRGKVEFGEGLDVQRDIRHVSFEHQRERLIKEADLEAVSQAIGHHYRGAPIIPADAPHFTKDVARRLGLSPCVAERSAATLSTGELNKGMLARALGEQPKLLLLDEVHNGLDFDARLALNGILQDMATKSQTQIVMVCHNAAEVPSFLTHTLEVENGVLSSDLYVPPQIEEQQWVFSNRRDENDDEAAAAALGQANNWNRDVISELDWKVRKGEHWAVVGPNGCGKSTLLELVHGHHPQGYANDISVLGMARGGRPQQDDSSQTNDGNTSRAEVASENIVDSSWNLFQLRQRIGVDDLGGGEKGFGEKYRIEMLRVVERGMNVFLLFQHQVVNPRLQMRYNKREKAKDVVLSGYFDTIGLYNACSLDQHDAAEKIMKKLDIWDLESVSFADLSLGQQARVLVARAMVKKPCLLILDEPCASLDAESREKLIASIDALAAGKDTTILYVTHHADSVPKCITNVLRLSINL
eukprot:jgi/Bigna1/133456/aug1.21_g8164